LNSIRVHFVFGVKKVTCRDAEMRNKCGILR
jgi:hypothetical protein